MEIQNIKIEDIKPYEKNPRVNGNAIEAVAKSIKEFGFKNPIILGKDNVIICGHTRYEASKRLNLKEIPCIIADDLSEEQIRAFRLVDNKTAELATWDESLLVEEMEKISFIDLTDFGFSIDEFKIDNIEELEQKHFEYQNATQDMVENILNLGYAQYEGVGNYDIPEIYPVYDLPKIKEWIGFNEVLSDDNPEGKAVHFFIDDYQFERVWNNPNAYIDKLKQYVCVASPDFSPYGDMPLITQIFNHYRKHWVARYMQERGITVIPTIRASSDKRSLDFYLDGEPRESIIIYSSMWATKSEEMKEMAIKEYNKMYEELKPTKIYIYGKRLEEFKGNIEVVKSFAEKRWSKKENQDG